MGTAGGGLNIFDSETKTFKAFMHSAEAESGISSNNVYGITEDTNGKIWLATEYGVNCFNPQTEKFQVYTVNEGLAHNTVKSLAFDNDGNLWIGTLNGLSQFNVNMKKFTNFTSSDGLQGKEFKNGAVLKASDSSLYFGGNNGFNHFDPTQITFNAIKPKIAITKLRLNNKTVKIGDVVNNRIILNENINTTDKVVFNYAQNVITLEFAALHFMSPKQNKYAYRLKGWVDSWTYTPAQNRTATYANLKPGEYVFEVIAANADGYWNNKGRQLIIEILPPWWATKTAFIIYVIIFISLIFLSRKIVKMKLDYQHSLNIEKLKNAQLAELHKKDHEIDQLKLVMFTNISHEFRTPLTLITGPLENIMNKIEDTDTKDQLKIVWRNAQRLLVLINQILDIRKLELGKYNLQLEKINLVKHISEIHQSFKLLARRNNLDFQLKLTNEEFSTYADSDIIEKVMYNLLSNAFKHTPRGGTVKVELNNTPHEFIIKVSDNGKGIPECELSKVFERFYMSKQNKNQLGTSSGIGLSLTKDLVELYGGNIQVKSIEGVGTTFTVKLPAFSEIPKNSKFKEALKVTTEPQKAYLPNAIDIDDYDLDISNTPFSDDKPTLLIVEDNSDMQKYLKSQFEENYNIAIAENGEKGFEKTTIYNPDLIISDVMMPVMNGVELCQKLKADIRTNHIPVILLTAKKSDSLQLQSLEIGADSYVNKPFNIDILKAKVKNILINRENLREKYSNELVNDDFAQEQNNADKVFLSKAIKVIEDNLTNEDFNVDIFASEVGMGRTTFYKKLKTISGYTVNDFIKIIRLKKAAYYLKYTKTSVTEIYYKVGFNDGSYFASCFQKQYGMLPTEYRKSNT
ncbi:MAG: response regulator [Prolixibacteraceae bacterium]|nr:response regulator [Prolixibacteraceae bacterium]